MAGPWERYAQGGASGDPIIAPADPYKQAAERRAQTDQAMQAEAAERARADQRMQEEKFRWERERAEADRAAGVGIDGNAVESERKAAAFLIRALGSNESYEKLDIGPRSLVGQTFADTAPNLLNTLPSAIGNSDDRQVADTNQDEFIAASLRQDSGAAIPPEELERQRRIYFPMPGDSPAAIAAKRQARLRAIEGLRQSAGRLEEATEARYAAMMSPEEAGGSSTDNQREDVAAPFPGVFDGQGKPLGPDGGMGYDAEGKELGFYGSVTDDSPTQAETIAANPIFAEPDAAVLARQGFTLGLADEAAGIGGAIGNLLQLENPVKGYQLWRDVERAQVGRARQNLGGVGTAIEVGSGFGGVANLPRNALLSVGQAARQGAGIGAVGGFGYGEGTEGSVINTLAGAALGGAIGGGAQMFGNALAPATAGRAQVVAQRGQRARDLTRAGQAEGVTVNRAMVDPALENRVTGVDATVVGGPRIQREMSRIEGQIEGRVGDLGQGGRAMNEMTGGQTIERAGQRFIDRTGKSAKAKYDRAARLAGDTKVPPAQSLQAVDTMIADLSETGSTSANELQFLNTLRGDLTKDLSVRGLRRIRTNLRQRISKGELTFGEDEARVLAIMDTAADDIRAGLNAQGKTAAANAFDAADKAYRARMEYITGTVQKVLGKRNANVPAEQMWRRFESMASARGDAVGLKRLYATLTPDERADVAATFAHELGRNNAGDFSVSHFLRQSEKLSDDALRTIFGKEGAESVANLRTLGREVKRVTGAMNSRKSGTGVANNYRDWLYNLLLGGIAGGGGAVTGGSSTAIAGAGAALGANAVRSALSARSLTSTKLTKWLAQAPRSATPQAINQHYARLGDIAKAEPALAGEIESLRSAIMNAANDNAMTVTSATANDNSQRTER